MYPVKDGDKIPRIGLTFHILTTRNLIKE